MAFQFQKISNYGTSTPVVARTLFQGSDLLKFFNVDKATKEEAMTVLLELQRHLLRCVAIRDTIALEVREAHEKVKAEGIVMPTHRGGVMLPAVVDVQSKAESFLQSAKLAIAETAKLVCPFYLVERDHQYHRFADWAEKQFGTNDEFTKLVRSSDPWVKTIVNMRNVVDHPKDEPGRRLVTHDFTLRSATPAELVDPTWGLTGELQRSIIPEMTNIVEGVLALGEEVLAALFSKLKSKFSIAVFIYEIPLEQRNPDCPTRLRVGFEGNFPLPG